MSYKDEKIQKEFQKIWYKNHKEEVLKRTLRDKARKRAYVAQFKNKPCMDCNQSFSWYVMDLDHRNGKEKLGGIAQLINSSWKRLLTEMKKCDVICSNCHRIRTYNRNHNSDSSSGRTIGSEPINHCSNQ